MKGSTALTFVSQVRLTTPGEAQRLAMLRCLASDRLTNLPTLASATPGFLPGDLALLVTRLSALETVSSADVEEELVRTRPATLRSGIGSVHTEAVSWDSLGGLEQEKLALRRAVELPLLCPQAFHRLGVRPSKGAHSDVYLFFGRLSFKKMYKYLFAGTTI